MLVLAVVLAMVLVLVLVCSRQLNTRWLIVARVDAVGTQFLVGGYDRASCMNISLRLQHTCQCRANGQQRQPDQNDRESALVSRGSGDESKGTLTYQKKQSNGKEDGRARRD